MEEVNFFDVVDFSPVTGTTAHKARNYKLDRLEIIEQLGRKCVKCGSYDRLELDEIIPNGCGAVKRMNRWTRIKFYRRELEKNNLQVLCRKCNAQKAAKPK